MNHNNKLTFFLRIAKRIWTICFTSLPYKIRRFQKIYEQEDGAPIDFRDSFSNILLQEEGNIFKYSLPIQISNVNSGEIGFDYNRYFKNKGILKEPTKIIYSVSNGCIYGQLGLVYNLRKRSFIEESAKEWNINLRRSSYTNMVSYPSKRILKGITISCLTIGADGGFYHFLFDSLSKMKLYDSIKHQFDHILFNGPVTDWKLKWVRKASIDESKIIWMENSGHYQCEQLLFTTRLINDQQINPWCVNALKDLFGLKDLNWEDKKIKILWITRKDLNIRNIEWEDKILCNFPMIEIVNLYSLDAEQTIEVFESATHIISPHGAGLSNIFICNRGTQILELFPNYSSFKPCYHRLSDICQLNHQIAFLNFNDPQDASGGIIYLNNILTDFICQK